MRSTVPGAKCSSRVSPRLAFYPGTGKFCIAKTNPAPPPADELLQPPHSLGADAAPVFGTHVRAARAVDRLLRVLIREDDDVVLVVESSGADRVVVQRSRPESVLLEYPPRPALVHVAAAPRLVHADARRADLHRGGGRAGCRVGRLHIEAERPRDVLDLFSGLAADDRAAGAPLTARFDRDARPLLEQRV